MAINSHPTQVHFFWAYGALSKLERLCINSFFFNGYEVSLWSYDEILNVPKGVQLKDANQILPENRVFTYKNGSYAGFANLFRYALLSTKGGLYADTDVICLTPQDKLPKYPFLVSERRPNASSKVKINNNVIYNPTPLKGDILDLAYVFTNSFPIEKLEWGDCGPKLLTMLVSAYPKLAFKIQPPEYANPINFWNCPKDLLATFEQPIPPSWGFLHCYNEMWRRLGINKEANYPAGSIMKVLEDRFLS